MAGRKFGNLETQKLYDKTHGSAGGDKGGESERMSAKEDEHDGADGGEETPIHQVVDEHGPAHTTTIKKTGETYSVHSHHEDGTKHMSKGHSSAHEAHQHSMQAMGEEPEEADEESMSSDEPPARSAMSIPGMG
jgi:hypothetical protein